MFHVFISGIGLSILMAGILYKLMHYKGSKLLLNSGLIISGIAFIWLFFIMKTANYKNLKMIIIRFIISIGTAIMSIVIVK